jgi:hypothetical protein
LADKTATGELRALNNADRARRERVGGGVEEEAVAWKEFLACQQCLQDFGYISIQTHIYPPPHTGVSAVSAGLWFYVYTDTRTHTYTHIHVEHVYIHTHIHTYILIHTRMHVCMYVCV